MKRIFKRAALGVALFLVGTSAAWPKKASPNLETYRDLISKSRVLLLQRDRAQASQILISAIHKEGLKSPAFPELSRALKKTAEIFFSEKAQQAYEMATAVYHSDRSHSIEILKETLSTEPKNAQLLKALLFAYLAQRECHQAQKSRLGLAEINPFDEDLDRWQLLELVCFNQKVEAVKLITKMDSQVLAQFFWQINQQRLFGSEYKPEPSVIENSGSIDYPERYFLLWLGEKDFKKRMVLAEKYKNLCHTPTPFDKSYAWFDPWVFEHLKELDDFHKKGERGN